MPLASADLSLLQIVKDLLGILGAQVTVVGVLRVYVKLWRDLQGEDFRKKKWEFSARNRSSRDSLRRVYGGVLALPGQQGEPRSRALAQERRQLSPPPSPRPSFSPLSVRLRPRTATCCEKTKPSFRSKQQKINKSSGGRLKDALLQVALVLGRHRDGTAFLGLLLHRFFLPAWNADLNLMSLWMKPSSVYNHRPSSKHEDCSDSFIQKQIQTAGGFFKYT